MFSEKRSAERAATTQLCQEGLGKLPNKHMRAESRNGRAGCPRALLASYYDFKIIMKAILNRVHPILSRFRYQSKDTSILLRIKARNRY